jgi:hypothetical protein
LQGRRIDDTTGGNSGVEPRVALMYTQMVEKRSYSLADFVGLVSANAARIMGLYPRKGALSVGSDADIVLLDPRMRRMLRKEDLHETDYTPWEGHEVAAWPSMTILRGNIAVENGRFLASPGGGQFLSRKIGDDIRSRPALGPAVVQRLRAGCAPPRSAVSTDFAPRRLRAVPCRFARDQLAAQADFVPSRFCTKPILHPAGFAPSPIFPGFAPPQFAAGADFALRRLRATPVCRQRRGIKPVLCETGLRPATILHRVGFAPPRFAANTDLRPVTDLPPAPGWHQARLHPAGFESAELVAGSGAPGGSHRCRSVIGAAGRRLRQGAALGRAHGCWRGAGSDAGLPLAPQARSVARLDGSRRRRIAIDLQTRHPQAGNAMRIDRLLPGAKLLDRQLVALAGFVEGQRAVAHRVDDHRLAPRHPSLCVGRG